MADGNSQLSMMRGKESRYLKPLMMKVDTLLDHGIPQPLVLPPGTMPLLDTTNNNDLLAPTGNGHVYDEEVTSAMFSNGRTSNN